MRTSIFYAMAAAKLAAAHSTFQSIVVDGKDQGQHFAVQTPSNGNNPIKDVTSASMTCNGGTATSDQVSVAAGSKLTMQWHHNDPASTGDSDEPIAASHKGPIMVYIAPAASAGKGAVWTKIYEDGYSGGTWAVDTFITNKGAIEVTLPNLAAGDYLIRPEIIALHEASTVGLAQFYNGCGQIKVTGSGSVALPSTGTDMTKAYSATDPGVNFNIYTSFSSYPIPGPAVWSGASSSSGTPAASSSQAATSTVAEVVSSSVAQPTTSAVAQPTTSVAATKAATSAAAAQPTTSAAATKPATSAAAPSASKPASSAAAQPTVSSKPTTFVTSTKPVATGTSGSVALYQRCGGDGYSGPTSCAVGFCKPQNKYYSQCVTA